MRRKFEKIDTLKNKVKEEVGLERQLRSKTLRSK
jgi:hypothetical protein